MFDYSLPSICRSDHLSLLPSDTERKPKIMPPQQLKKVKNAGKSEKSKPKAPEVLTLSIAQPSQVLIPLLDLVCFIFLDTVLTGLVPCVWHIAGRVEESDPCC